MKNISIFIFSLVLSIGMMTNSVYAVSSLIGSAVDIDVEYFSNPYTITNAADAPVVSNDGPLPIDTTSAPYAEYADVINISNPPFFEINIEADEIEFVFNRGVTITSLPGTPPALSSSPEKIVSTLSFLEFSPDAAFVIGTTPDIVYPPIADAGYIELTSITYPGDKNELVFTFYGEDDEAGGYKMPAEGWKAVFQLDISDTPPSVDIPEPSTYLLLGSSLLLVAIRRKRLFS